MKRLEPRRPPGLRAVRFEVDGQQLAVLSLPLREAKSPDSLTPSETEVLDLVLDGHSNKEIAARRSCSASTVANQIQSIFRKTGVNSRNELAALLFGGRAQSVRSSNR